MQNLYLSDITLKLSQRPNDGFTLSFREKIEAAKLLDRLEVSAIELAPIENVKIDSLLVKSIASAVRRSTVALPVGRDCDGVKTAWAALRDARHPRLQLEAPMSFAQMEYFWHRKPEKMLEIIAEILSACRETGAEVEFIAQDACRGDRDFLYRAIRAAIAAGCDIVTLSDAAGEMLPDEMGAFVCEVRKNVPECENVRLGVCCSDQLAMANACTIAAVQAGITEVKATACHANTAHLESLARILTGRSDTLGLECGVRTSEIHRISVQIERMCHGARSANSPFDGGVQSAADAGQMLLSAHDDRAAVMKAVEKIGYDLTEEDGTKVFEAFRRIVEHKESVSARELDIIVASAAMQVPPTYTLTSYMINCSNIISASAHMKLERDGQALEGICVGDGPIDAAFLAMEQVVGHHYELDDFQIQAVTEGHEAMGEALVRLRSNGKLYSGRGISTDIVGASIHAYLSALNKIVYEEAEA